MGMSYADTPSIWEGCINQQGLWKSRHLSLAAEEHEWEGQEGRDWERTLVEKVEVSMMIK